MIPAEQIIMFLAIPVLVLIAFGILFFVYRKRKKEAGAHISDGEREKLKNLKTYVIVTGITAAVFWAVLIGLTALLMMVVAGM